MRRIPVAGILILCAGLLMSAWGTAQQPPPTKPTAPEYKFSGPFTHDNLTIFLIHGEDRFKGRKYMMLADALDKKLFVIYETQSVNELNMENLSGEEVLILAGDILKGGQQDRIAQNDQLVPPKSGKLPLTVFCVEHTASRWGGKLIEEDKTFKSSPGQICSSELRLAARYKGEQGEVWKGVAKCQEKLSMNAKTDVKDKASDSSLALSLKVKEVQAAVDRYVAKLEPIARDKGDVLGFAVAINGKVYSADIYGSPSMFQKVWPRLLHANCIEAFAELQKDKTYPPLTVAAVKSFLAEGDKGQVKDAKDVGKEIRSSIQEGSAAVRFESKDKKSDEQLRQNYLKK